MIDLSFSVSELDLKVMQVVFLGLENELFPLVSVPELHRTQQVAIGKLKTVKHCKLDVEDINLCQSFSRCTVLSCTEVLNDIVCF